jgi:hypothetical protein
LHLTWPPFWFCDTTSLQAARQVKAVVRQQNMKISDVDVAKAVIAHEAVDCFLANEESASKQRRHLVFAL